MNKSVIIGLVAGLVLGVIESMVYSTETGVARLVSDLTLASGVLGVIVGLVRPKFPATWPYIGVGGAIGAVTGLALGMRSGMYLDDGVLMLINGLIIAAAVVFIGKRQAAAAP